MRPLDRRAVVGGGVAFGAAVLLGSTSSEAKAADIPDVASVDGPDPFASALRAVEALGGIGCFVPRGAYGGSLHGARPAEVPVLGMSVVHGLGRADLSQLVVRELTSAQ